MKRALLLNAVNPGIGGYMWREGTAKSTAVRALADVLPRSGRAAHTVAILPAMAAYTACAEKMAAGEILR